MKRAERRALEKELQLLGQDEIKLDPEQDARIIEWVRTQYMQQIADAPAKQPVRGKKIGHRVLYVFAAAVLLLVCSFGYTVFTPNAVSQAKGFMHRATVWMNDTFHLNLEIEVPPEDLSQNRTGDGVFYSFEDAAAANPPYPLVCLQDPEAVLQSIEVQRTSAVPEMMITYSYGSNDIRIQLVQIGENYQASLQSPDTDIISWQGGEMACWNLESRKHATTYYSGTEITLSGYGDLSYDAFLDLCRTLAPIN